MSETQPVVDQGVVAGNYYDKYGTRNPIARRMMQGFVESVYRLVQQANPADVHEVGCGEGLLSLLLVEKFPHLRVRGSDFSNQIIASAQANAQRRGRQVPFRVASIYDLEPGRDAADLVVCCEVLEHLEDPAVALDILARLARPYMIASVPREPMWRILNMARGKYLGHLGNTPGHLNHWSSGGFVRLLSQRFQVVTVLRPTPWTMALCKSKAGSS